MVMVGVRLITPLLKDWCLFRDENMEKWVFCFSEIEKAILMRQCTLTMGNLLSVHSQECFLFSVHAQMADLPSIHSRSRRQICLLRPNPVKLPWQGRQSPNLEVSPAAAWAVQGDI